MVTKAQVQAVHDKDSKISRSWRQRLKDFTTLVFERTPEAVTATTDGTGTGLIPADALFVTITCDTATKQVSLPAANIGKRIELFVGANGCELISAVAAHKVNNVVVGATNEAAIPANTHCVLTYVDTNTWLLTAYNNLGAVITAIVPDAR